MQICGVLHSEAKQKTARSATTRQVASSAWRNHDAVDVRFLKWAFELSGAGCSVILWPMKFYEYPEWTQYIRNRYWYLRFARSFDGARKRKEYRLIEKEKKRLHEAGVDCELVRLYCRHMVNLRNKKAEQRFWTAYQKSLQNPLPF
jgi:hypothetical protein